MSLLLMRFLFVFLIVLITLLIRFVTRANTALKEMLALFLICVLSCAATIITPDVFNISPLKLLPVIIIIFIAPFSISLYFILSRDKKTKKTEREFYKRLIKLSSNPDVRKHLEDINRNQNS